MLVIKFNSPDRTAILSFFGSRKDKIDISPSIHPVISKNVRGRLEKINYLKDFIVERIFDALLRLNKVGSDRGGKNDDETDETFSITI